VLDVVLDGAILGVSAIYPSQRAGIWRFLREWMAELASRPEVRLRLVSSGRAPWNELALEQARLDDPFLSGVPHHWHPRRGAFPPWRRLQSRAARTALRWGGARLSPTAKAGILQALQPGLGRIPSPIEGGVYHSPYHALPSGVPESVVRSLTIHDLIPVLFPQWFDDTTPFRKALASVGPDDLVFVGSSSTRDDAVRHLGIEPGRVHVASPGVSAGFRPRPREECVAQLARLGIPPVRFLLAVGTLEPRKNLSSLLEAFARIARHPGNDDLHLVLTGARGWKNEVFDATFSRLGDLRSRVIATGFLAEADLPLLYGACEAFVYPSLYEGFGLPIVEAQACGAAVVGVANSSQPEVAGEVSVLAADGSPPALAAAMGQILSSPESLSARRAAGPAQAARFTWARCVDAYLEGWRGEAERRRHRGAR